MSLKSDDILPYGPYAGYPVSYVLEHDPGELLERHFFDALTPKYILDPSILQQAQEANEKTFLRLWNNV
jgi:hypothetical protein